MPRSSSRVIGCIPSRYESRRLPGKPLRQIAGKPLILHVVERAQQAKQLDEVVVLTDDQRIKDVIEAAGFRCESTSNDCRTGTDRVYEYAQRAGFDHIYVNIQGDELTIEPQHIDRLIEEFKSCEHPEMGTLAYWVSDVTILQDPGVAKIVTDTSDNALYFSRCCIPSSKTGSLPGRALVQIGVYIYTAEALQRFSQARSTLLEEIEGLEQLRALQNHISIKIVTVDKYEGLSVDTLKDLDRANEIFSKH